MISRWCQRLSRPARAEQLDPAWIYWISQVVLMSFDCLSAFPASHGSHGTSTAGAPPLCQGRPAVLWLLWPWCRAASNLQPGPRDDQPSVGEIPVLWSLMWNLLLIFSGMLWLYMVIFGERPWLYPSELWWRSQHLMAYCGLDGLGRCSWHGNGDPELQELPDGWWPQCYQSAWATKIPGVFAHAKQARIMGKQGWLHKDLPI